MLNGCTAAAVATGNPVAAVKPTRVAISPVASSVKPVPLSATVSLSGHDWGTRIEMNCTYGAGPPVTWAAKPSVATSSYGVAVTSTSTVVGVLSPARSPRSLWRGAFHHRGVRRGRGSAMTRTSRRA